MLLVFPAPAGMSLFLNEIVLTFLSFPRTCGDEPYDAAIRLKHDKFYPHLRG